MSTLAVTVGEHSHGEHSHGERSHGGHDHEGAGVATGAGAGSAAGENPRPPGSSQAVMVDVGGDRGALVLRAAPEREGLEVEIHPAGCPAERTHVWVLPREIAGGVAFAAVFPSLPEGEYEVLSPSGTPAGSVTVVAGQVSFAAWQ